MQNNYHYYDAPLPLKAYKTTLWYNQGGVALTGDTTENVICSNPVWSAKRWGDNHFNNEIIRLEGIQFSCIILTTGSSCPRQP